jgi:hypothetical protein
VCASCAKSARSFVLCLNFSLYLVLNKKFKYGHKDDLRNSYSNTIILKLRGVFRNQLCDPPHGLKVT